MCHKRFDIITNEVELSRCQTYGKVESISGSGLGSVLLNTVSFCSSTSPEESKALSVRLVVELVQSRHGRGFTQYSQGNRYPHNTVRPLSRA
jgi:hypothetical protein